MTSKQCLSSVVHPSGVKRSAHTPGSPVIEGQVRSSVHNPIKVAASDRIKTGMETLIHFLRDEYRDPVRAKISVQCVTDLVNRQRADEIDMRDLSEGMDAGVCPSRPNHVPRFSPNAGCSGFQNPLNCGLPSLSLPSGKR